MKSVNIQLTIILLAVGSVLGVGTYFLHSFQVQRNAYVFKDAADRALERAKKADEENDVQQKQKSYSEAMQNLGWYLRLRPDRTDVLVQLATLSADRANSPRSYGRAFGMLEAALRQDQRSVSRT